MTFVHGRNVTIHSMRIAPAGDCAFLVELGEVDAAPLRRSASGVRDAAGVIAVVPGQSSLLVIGDGAIAPDAIEAAARAGVDRPAGATTHHLRLSLRDEFAPDLGELLARAGISKRALISRLAQLELTARYIGFRAGFAYLDGWPAAWAMPRRPTSRPVSRNSFAVAGAVTGFYPIDTPGGWNVIGRTDAALWDESRNPAGLIAPGDRVVLEPTTDELVLPPLVNPPALAIDGIDLVDARLARVVRACRDWSRVNSGIPSGGAFDMELAQQANRSVGNPPDAPVIECALVGVRLIARRHLFLSWQGSPADIRAGSREIRQPALFRVAAGEEVSIGRIRGGLRGWLAVGPREEPQRALWRDGDRLLIRAIRGPHESALGSCRCRVTPQLDRVGVRLELLESRLDGAPSTLGSCGMQPGTTQLHPDGSLVIMGPDHPVTGGYQQPFTVLSTELWKVAQLTPGEEVVFEVAGSPGHRITGQNAR